MYYYNYLVERWNSHLKITADKFLDFKQSDNELVMQGTPKWWDDYVLSKINLCDFNIYFICMYTVTHGQYNKVTDYKKVWGLHRIEKGFYDNFYENTKGRVYFGIQKGNEQHLLKHIDSSTILLLPKKFELDADKIFNIFRKHKFDFSQESGSGYQTYIEVNMLYNGSYLLKYNSTDEVSLLIFNNQLKDWFDSNILASAEGACETVFRKP